MPYAKNKDAEQPAHPRSLISTFVVHCLDGIIPALAIYKISRFPEDKFSHDVAHFRAREWQHSLGVY